MKQLTMEQTVRQSTLIHPEWNELDHMQYLINEAGFDGEEMKARIGDIINAMLLTRLELRKHPEAGAYDNVQKDFGWPTG